MYITGQYRVFVRCILNYSVCRVSLILLLHLVAFWSKNVLIRF